MTLRPFLFFLHLTVRVESASDRDPRRSRPTLSLLEVGFLGQIALVQTCVMCCTLPEVAWKLLGRVVETTGVPAAAWLFKLATAMEAQTRAAQPPFEVDVFGVLFHFFFVFACASGAFIVPHADVRR